jgi:hypothetical protein
VPVHLVIVLGLILMLGGLVAISHTIEGGLASALAALFNILFAGITFILHGLAVAWSGGHPRSLGWTVLVAAVGSILAGLVQAYAGEPVTFTRVATIIFPTVITLWVAWIGAAAAPHQGWSGQDHAVTPTVVVAGEPGRDR